MMRMTGFHPQHRLRDWPCQPEEIRSSDRLLESWVLCFRDRAGHGGQGQQCAGYISVFFPFLLHVE